MINWSGVIPAKFPQRPLLLCRLGSCVDEMAGKKHWALWVAQCFLYALNCEGVGLAAVLFVAVVARLLVCALGEEVGVGVRASVFEVENGFGVDGVAHESGLEVEVGACASSGVASQCYGLSGFHILVWLHEEA